MGRQGRQVDQQEGQTSTSTGRRRARVPVWPRPQVAITAARRLAALKPRLGKSPLGKPRLGRFRVVLPLIAALILLLGIGSCLALWSMSQTLTNYNGSHFNTGQNAIWLEHAWAAEAHEERDYDALAARLKAEQVTYVFAHVGPLDSDGRIPYDRALFASNLADALHARIPNIHVLAWIGQLEAASGEGADQTVNLDDSTVRARIAATAKSFVVDKHFDGVHYDIEPILNNSPRFLDLLDETRAALPKGALISIAAEKWAPNATAASWADNAGHAHAWWTSYYYAALATHVDQMVVMAYNTGMPTAGLYQIFVKQQVQHILDAVQTARHPPQVLMGIPTYAEDGAWHHSGAENMATGLAGVTAGLNSTQDDSPFGGVAIYRFGVTSDGDWKTYDKAWLGK